MKFSVMGFFSKYEQIRRKQRICAHLLKICLTHNFIFCAKNYRLFTLPSHQILNSKGSLCNLQILGEISCELSCSNSKTKYDVTMKVAPVT